MAAVDVVLDDVVARPDRTHGIGERLSGGNEAIALLANSVATGCSLWVLISLFGPLSGAHFNPTQKHHGGPMTLDHHAGDLGNIEADASGKAHLDWKGKLSLSGKDSIIGKSVVVHEKEDDLKTDPSGNSGARIACGAINAAD